MDIQLAQLRIAADDAYPPLPRERAYALVIIAHEETTTYWRRGLAEQLAVGGCVQVNLWGEQSDDWRNDIDAANALALMTEERSEYLPDIEVSNQSNHIIDDVFEYAAAHMQTTEAHELSLLIVLEIGEPVRRYDLQSMACRAARDCGAMAGFAC